MTPTLTLSARIIGLAAALIFALLAALAPGAKAELKTFPAVDTSDGKLVFELEGVEGASVDRAKVRMQRHDGSRAVRKVGARKIRRAIKRDRPVVLRRPSSVRTGRLKVAAKKANSGSTGGTTCELANVSALSPPGACWRPYSDASPFNRRVPADAPVVSNSSAIVKRWASFSINEPKFEAGTSGTSYDYEHPIYYSLPTDPVYTVRCTESWGTCEVEGMQVRIPAQAKPAAGGDGHLAVIDPLSGWEYDFWQVASKPVAGGTLKVSWGGRTAIGTADADGLDSNATAAHFGLAAGVIRPEELAAGEINHALFMVSNCTNGRSVAPAGSGTGRSCSSIGLSNTNAPAMGQHFVLDMSHAEINSLDAPAWQKTILRAMADYGLYVGDTGGGFVKLQSGASYTSFGLPDPWMKLGRDLGVDSWESSSTGTTKYLFDMRETIDWSSRLQVVDPCVSQGTC